MEIEQFDEERVREWETGLPNAIDLTPLSHHLLSPELASAFSITAEPFQTMLDVNRASQNTLSSLRRHNSGFSSNNFKSLSSFMENRCVDSDPDPDPVPIPIVVDEDEPEPEPDLREKRKILEEADSEMRMDNFNEDCSAKTLKRARLVWTPQLHKRFVDVVAHLGIDSAVPKTIMQLMNVEGLTRENVASHLQKYRLYLKRMNEGATTPNDQLFASAPVPPSLREGSGNRHKTVVPAPPPPPPPVAAKHVAPVLSAPSHASGGHMKMPGGNAASGGAQYNPYGMFRENQGHWSGNNFGSVVPHSHVSPNDQ